MKRLEKALKAYDNREFLHSSDGRTVRILTEYLYPEQYFRKYVVENTIVFYGSARTLSVEDQKKKIKFLDDKLNNLTGKEAEDISRELDKEKNLLDVSQSYDDAVELARRIAEWSLTLPEKKRFFITSGGGPGMMEAANKGADKAGAPSIGLNISLPFEQFPNQYITPDLNFEFHYFFMRKFWFSYHCRAIVAMPGGYGTLDELMDILTLIQTKKITRRIPIVLYDENFWKNVVNFDFMVEKKMISPEDLDLFVFKNTPEEAFEYIKKELEEIYEL